MALKTKMENDKISKKTIEECVKVFSNRGDTGLYKWAVGNAIISIQHNKYPESDLLNYSNHFFSLARGNGDDSYFIIGRVLRRAAHKVYRALLPIHEDRPINAKFLNLLK